MILKEDLLLKVTEKEIMEFYWGDRILENRAIYKNPMRLDCGGTCYFKMYGNDKFVLTDRAAGMEANFDCFKYVMWLYNCSFYEALIRINNEMLLNLTSKLVGNVRPDPASSIIPNKRGVNFQIKLREWNQHDKDYWAQFGIQLSTVNKVIKPVQSYKSDSRAIVFKLKYTYDELDPCYVYSFKSSVKLYQPYSKLNKWRSNTSNSDIFGYAQLPHFGSYLFIASGAKDMMCLWEMGYNAIAPQSESIDIPEYIMDGLKDRFDNIYYIYDNDIAGIKMSTSLLNNII